MLSTRFARRVFPAQRDSQSGELLNIIGVLPATSCSTRSEIRADVSCRLRSVLSARFSRKPYEGGV